MRRRLWPAAAIFGCALIGLVAWALLSRPHLPWRIARFDGEWFLEHCGRWSAREVFGCTDGIDWVTELEIDEDGDGSADLQTYFWTGSRPRECEEWRDGKWRPLQLAECCCRAGCSVSGMREVDAGCLPSP